ncbi:MAG: thioesterase family protein [Bacteroidales bacterium]|nr:thioesterase family protein [Bacteroidales bacterium]
MANVNDTYKVEITVQDCDTAIVHKSGGLPVYATPAMIALMENAAFSLLKNEEKDSVGTEMNVKHTRACLVGAKVYAQATVTGVNGNWVTFNVAAYDEKGEIGNGNHTRYVIDPVKFMAKLNG